MKLENLASAAKKGGLEVPRDPTLIFDSPGYAKKYFKFFVLAFCTTNKIKQIKLQANIEWLHKISETQLKEMNVTDLIKAFK